MARLRVILLSLHLALFASIFLSVFLKVPLIREIIGFVYLTFIPGFVLISMFRLRLNLTETILYSVGASLSLVMLLGLIANQFYPLIGVKKPLSLIPILVTMSVVTLFCSFKIDEIIQIKFTNLALFVLSFILLSFLSIFGTYLFNMYNINTLNLIVILLIAIVPILISFKKIPQEFIPFVIYIVAFSILYNVCLVSAYLWGWDIHPHYHSTLITYWSLHWNSSKGPLLLTTIVPTIYSVITGINLVWFYKSIFPFFVTLIPLGIYELCRKEFDNWYIPALAPFSFMFYYWFYKTFPIKQIPSELFLILIVGLLIDDRLPNFSRMIMLILLSFGLAVSHYGVSYFFMIVLLLMLILYVLKFGVKQSFVVFNFVAIYLVLIVGWYMFVCNSYKFDQIANLGYSILTNLVNLIKSPPARSGVNYLEYSTPTLVWKFYKYINVVFVTLLSIGIFKLLYSFIKNKLICNTYIFSFISIGTYAFLLSSIVVTYCMGFDRTLQVSLPVLSPYVVVGFVCLSDMVRVLVNNISNLRVDIHIDKKIIKLIGIFFAVYFLFNSGFMFYVTGNKLPPYCIALDKKCWKTWKAFYLSEVCGVLWLKSHYSGKVTTLHTKISLIMDEFYGQDNYNVINGYHIKHISPGVYMYFSSVIVVNKRFRMHGVFVSPNEVFLYRTILNSSRIYTSGYDECCVT